MERALHVKTKVLPGERIELDAPGLTVGEEVEVEVFVVAEERPRLPRRPALEIIQDLQAGGRAPKDWEEFERQFQEERNAWDR